MLAVTRTNANVASVVQFLHRLVDVFKHYFQELEEESLRDNFVIVYELLDEVCDFGYPQFTEAKILSVYIKTDAYKMEVAVKPPMAVTNAVSWRTEGIKYKKNEVGGHYRRQNREKGDAHSPLAAAIRMLRCF